MSALADGWCRSIPSLRENPLRVAFLRSELLRHPLPAVARALDELCGRAEQADPIARQVLASLTPSLADASLVALVDALRAHAQADALLPLGRLLRRRARGEPAPDVPVADARQLLTNRAGRTLTLGERKALARRPSRSSFDRLLRDPHPMVIRNLLGNPRVTEDDVVRLAARRPAYPDVLAEVARHPEWSQRARVRMAILQNPGSPAEIAVPLVGLLIRPELNQIMAATDISPVVRVAAGEMLDRRPPVPERPGGRSEPQ